MQIGSPATDGNVTVLMFAAHWCGHCDEHVPGLERLSQEYANRVGEAINFVAVMPTTGNGGAVSEAVERWGAAHDGQAQPADNDLGSSSPANPDAASRWQGWTVAIDRGMRAATTYGVKAYPVVFLIGRDGIVEAVHGRWSNTRRNNGIDTIEAEVRTQLDLLLAGKTRADFPPATQPAIRQASAAPRSAGQSPAATRPARAAASTTSQPTAG